MPNVTILTNLRHVFQGQLTAGLFYYFALKMMSLKTRDFELKIEIAYKCFIINLICFMKFKIKL